MENQIKILPQSLSNKIAAGEVVSRPESVVKELIENAIDAGADNIDLIIAEAGKTLVQVIDNGNGMDEENAVLSFQRHSTSKIYTYEDLENIQTLGFRGEALASIASISQVEMKTRTEKNDVGTLIKIDGSEVKEISKTACEKGTSISVRNLFYNTPARRNFLKSNQTEFKHIYESFIKLAISNPPVAFTFTNNNEKIFQLNQEDLLDRLKNIFNEEFTNSLIPVKSESRIIKLTGYISKPSFTKKAKQDQYFYLNNRFFTSKNLNYAVYSAYEHLIEKGDYPSFFLFIELDTKKVDVNVHPSKLEVKFEDEGAVFGFIRNSIKECLGKFDLIFEMGFLNKAGFTDDEETFAHKEGTHTTLTFGSERKTIIPKDTFSHKETKIHSIFEAEKIFSEEKSEETKKEKDVYEHKRNDSEGFNIWQYQYKYILCQTETGLIIIDQHAAHERILYEKAVLMLNSQSSFSQQLLIPITVKLTKIDYQILQSLETEMKSLGFNFRNINKNEAIELTGIPSDVRIGDEGKIIQELIDQYKEYELKLNLEKRDNLAKSFACRSAIKTGDKLSKEEMLSLIDKLFSASMPYVCPHGRPTIIRITTEELDKRFSRS